MDKVCDAEVDKLAAEALKAMKAQKNTGTLTSAQKDKIFGEAFNKLLRKTSVKQYLRVLPLIRLPLNTL